MIGIGINENVMLAKADTSEKGALQLYFETAKEKVSVFESLQTAKVENDDSTRLMMFPFKWPTGPRNVDKTVDELLEMVSDDMKKVKNQLTQLLEQYLIEADIKWDPYVGTGISNENYRELFQQDESLAKIFDNYAEQFISMITPFLGNPAYKLRVKLVRQSKDKHFATIPGKFLADNPWVELMEVPVPKVLFTKWEIDNKLNDSTPIAKPDAIEGGEDIPEGKSAFGSR